MFGRTARPRRQVNTPAPVAAYTAHDMVMAQRQVAQQYENAIAGALAAVLNLAPRLLEQLKINPLHIVGVPTSDGRTATFAAGELFTLQINPFDGQITLGANKVMAKPVEVWYKDPKTGEITGLSANDYLLLYGFIAVVESGLNLKTHTEELLASLGLSREETAEPAIAAQNGHRERTKLEVI
ncbi:MAG TPA: hypothetical protein VLF91_03570 [Candidatus Saccharimonadales bacterium]|nr:hypothetical protein [Candidatus Saccharimonadales bacterium]